jgi:hypothetical protein
MRRVAFALLLAACSNRASQEECERAADRMIDIITAPRAGEGGKVLPEVARLSEEWKKNLRERDPVTRGALVSACRSRMTDDHVECILAAMDERSLAGCFGE